MGSVGIRDLKNGLSAYLKRVRQGEIIEVTDRGKTIARIVPEGVPPHIAKLVAEGRLTWPGRTGRRPFNPVKLKPGGPRVSDIISEDRR